MMHDVPIDDHTTITESEARIVSIDYVLVTITRSYPHIKDRRLFAQARIQRDKWDGSNDAEKRQIREQVFRELLHKEAEEGIQQ